MVVLPVSWVVNEAGGMEGGGEEGRRGDRIDPGVSSTHRIFIDACYESIMTCIVCESLGVAVCVAEGKRRTEQGWPPPTELFTV